MVLAGNKAKRISSVNHTAKTIHHHHHHQELIFLSILVNHTVVRLPTASNIQMESLQKAVF